MFKKLNIFLFSLFAIITGIIITLIIENFNNKPLVLDDPRKQIVPYDISVIKSKQCEKIPGKKVWLISYADGNDIHFQNQRFLSASALLNCIDNVKQYSFADVDPAFVKKNIKIFGDRKNYGAGYYLWKPYIIYKALNEIPEGDIIIWADSGVNFLSPMTDYLKEMVETKSDTVFFFSSQKYLEKHFPGKWNVGTYTKRQALRYFDMDNDKYRRTNSILIHIIIINNSKKMKQFYKEWLKVSQIPEIIMTGPRAEDEYPNTTHNHDQSLLGMLRVKYEKKYKFLKKNSYLHQNNPWWCHHHRTTDISLPINTNDCEDHISSDCYKKVSKINQYDGGYISGSLDPTDIDSF